MNNRMPIYEFRGREKSSFQNYIIVSPTNRIVYTWDVRFYHSNYQRKNAIDDINSLSPSDRDNQENMTIISVETSKNNDMLLVFLASRASA